MESKRCGTSRNNVYQAPKATSPTTTAKPSRILSQIAQRLFFDTRMFETPPRRLRPVSNRVVVCVNSPNGGYHL